VPDFTYAGQGYRIAEVLPDSPAARAGLQAGDIIVQLGATAIPDLPAFANVLRTLQPGERITIMVRRGEAVHTMDAQLAPR
jgi:S1-C subfamily serine protease